MLTAILITIAAQAEYGSIDEYVRVRRVERVSRAGPRSGPGYAFFEFAPASGAGMTSACACTSPTGAKSEALTFTRTGAATCSKKGLTTTGIANGDLVVCASNNQPRVEPDADGVLGLRVEAARTNSLLRSDELTVSPWADVGTPTVTDGATSPFGTATADTIDDNDAVAYEGRSQAVTVTSGAAYTLACYLKAGTASSARLLIDGTAINATSLSSTTWTRAEIADAAASSTSITVQVLVGDVTSVTGTVIFGGCDVQNGTYATAYIPTTSAAATRNIEDPRSTLATAVGPTASIAATVQFSSANIGAVNMLALGSLSTSNMTLYRTSNTAAGYQINTVISAPAVSAMGTTTHRSALADNAGTRSAFWDGASVAAPAASMAAGQTDVYIGRNVSGLPIDGIITRVCIDPDASRCR